MESTNCCTMKQINIVVIYLIFSISSFVYSQDTINVPADQSTIQAALDIATDGTSILLAPGIYYENLVWPLIDGIKLIGVEGKDQIIIDGQNLGRVIVLPMTYTDKTELSGFTIQNGYLSDQSGAGLTVVGGNPKLYDLRFIDNTIETGGGAGAAAYLFDFSGTIENCEFVNNIADIYFGSSFGGALHLHLEGDAIVKNCLFDSNEASSKGNNWGVGLFVSSDSNLDTALSIKIQNCSFKNNRSFAVGPSYGGALYIHDRKGFIVEIDSSSFTNNTMNDGSHGAGVFTGCNDTTISNCSFSENVSETGAGLYLSNGLGDDCQVSINKCVFINNTNQNPNDVANGIIEAAEPMDLKLENCLIANNIGNALVQNGLNGSLNIDHCTVAQNTNGIVVGGVAMNAKNSIFWNNGDEEITVNSLSFGIFDINSSIVANGFSGVSIINEDPLFNSQDNFIPRIESPCISAGEMINITTDIQGNPRPLPLGTNPDIGSYEIDQSTVSAKDLFGLDITSYPNPASSTIFLSDAVEQISVYDAQGKLVTVLKLTQEIDVRQFEAGTYFVEYQKDGKVGKDSWVVVR